ncbi:hypothetical protein VMCG_10045 [Cytospora schulzeri]|uniref:Uncharacterized protein n=1 Tax=Cytospora schulzeri TaxID=448051 RepID=A0A423VCU7_9PEZI|nr:hypothetical protein VMCG_10045 [Valsa malicola]
MEQCTMHVQKGSTYEDRSRFIQADRDDFPSILFGDLSACTVKDLNATFPDTRARYVPRSMLAESERVQALETAKRLVASLEKPNVSEGVRVEALRDAGTIVSSLEKTEDAMLKFAYTPTIWMCIRVFVQLKIFPMLSEKDETSIQEIRERTQADTLLLERLFRVLTGAGFVAEKGVRVYDQGMLTHATTPDYLEKTGYRNPNDSRNAPFQEAFKCPGEGLFEWLLRPENAKQWETLNTFFEGDRGSRPSWVTWFPAREKLIDGSNPDTPLLVDIGGGRGHDLMEFSEQFPNAGPLVLQDQQYVLDSATSLPDTVRKHTIDFFKESPVRGARIYFLKFVLHDWSDEASLTILRNISASMTKGYSYLVINDFILPDKDCPLISSLWDMQMMLVMAAMERSDTQWRDLMNKAGLQIEGLYQPPGDGQGIIVATLA